MNRMWRESLRDKQSTKSTFEVYSRQSIQDLHKEDHQQAIEMSTVYICQRKSRTYALERCFLFVWLVVFVCVFFLCVLFVVALHPSNMLVYLRDGSI